jgi:hypothetical protein
MQERTTCKEWQQENLEQMRAYRRTWDKANPVKRAINESKRRAHKRGNSEAFTYVEWVKLKTQYENRCLCCGRDEATLLCLGLQLVPDHVQALSESGSNSINNIQPLCHGKGGCNNKKHSKNIDYRKP